VSGESAVPCLCRMVQSRGQSARSARADFDAFVYSRRRWRVVESSAV